MTRSSGVLLGLLPLLAIVLGADDTGNVAAEAVAGEDAGAVVRRLVHRAMISCAQAFEDEPLEGPFLRGKLLEASGADVMWCARLAARLEMALWLPPASPPGRRLAASCSAPRLTLWGAAVILPSKVEHRWITLSSHGSRLLCMAYCQTVIRMASSDDKLSLCPSERETISETVATGSRPLSRFSAAAAVAVVGVCAAAASPSANRAVTVSQTPGAYKVEGELASRCPPWCPIVVKISSSLPLSDDDVPPGDKQQENMLRSAVCIACIAFIYVSACVDMFACSDLDRAAVL